MRLVTLLAAGIAALSAPSMVVQAIYSQVADIQIGGPLPATWDYLNVDSASKRLYVSHGTEAVVIDLTTEKIVGRVADTPRIHGIAIAPDLGRGFTSNGGENKVSMFDLKSLSTASKIDTGGANPDAITYDQATKEVWAFNHTGMSAAEIDAAAGTLLATIPLSGTAETGQVDAAAGRVYVNIEDKDAVDVIDIKARKVVATWPVAPASTPTGMALDAASHRLFVGGGKSLVMIDTTSGKVVASAPICTGTDATWFDPGTRLAFASCSDGHITVARMEGPSALAVVQTIDTAPRSRTMALDAATHKLYVAAVKLLPPDPNAPAPAAGTRGRGPAADPNSFHVLVYGMGK